MSRWTWLNLTVSRTETETGLQALLPHLPHVWRMCWWCSAKFKRVVQMKFATNTVVIQNSDKTTIYECSSPWDHRKPIFFGIPPWGTHSAVRIHKFTHTTHTYHANTSCHYLESMMKRASSTLQPIADRVAQNFEIISITFSTNQNFAHGIHY